MTKIKTILLLLALSALVATAADKGNAAKTASWLDNITAAPVGALRTADIDGDSVWGAGLDLGYKVNSFVSLHVVNLSFEDAETSSSTKTKEGTSTSRSGGGFGGLLVDETDLQVRADLTKFKKNSFTPYVYGSGQRDWNAEDWGFGVGVGAELRLHKNVALAGDYSLRAWFNRDKDSLARLLLNISF